MTGSYLAPVFFYSNKTKYNHRCALARYNSSNPASSENHDQQPRNEEKILVTNKLQSLPVE